MSKFRSLTLDYLIIMAFVIYHIKQMEMIWQLDKIWISKHHHTWMNTRISDEISVFREILTISTATRAVCVHFARVNYKNSHLHLFKVCWMKSVLK